MRELCLCLVHRNICREMGAHELLSINFTDNVFSKVLRSFVCFSSLAGLQMLKMYPPSTGREVSEYSEGYVEIKCQLDATEVFIADHIICSTCFGHHYAHHQELKSGCCLWYFVLWFSSCWSSISTY